MKVYIRILCLAALTSAAWNASAQSTPPGVSYLTGDPKTACQAVMCLSTSHDPSECTPPLQKYFSIHAKYPWDTIKERLNFLKLCPASNSSPSMTSLVTAIANGAGRCDANSLNTEAAESVNVTDSNGNAWTISEVSSTAPDYCSALFTNPLTDYNTSGPVYIGTPDNGGFWVDGTDVAAGKAKYAAEQTALGQGYQSSVMGTNNWGYNSWGANPLTPYQQSQVNSQANSQMYGGGG